MDATSGELTQGQANQQESRELPLGVCGAGNKRMSETTGESERCSLVSLHTADVANMWFYIVCENQNSFWKNEPREGAKPP